MAARDSQSQLVRRPQGRCWIALPTALLANALLFYALAAARTTPSWERANQTTPVHIAVIDSSSLDATEPDVTQAEPDVIPLTPQRISTRTAEATPEATAALTTRLPNRIDAATPELPGLPVVLPDLLNLRSLPGTPVSEVTGPLSLSEVDRAPRKIAGTLPPYPRWAQRAGLEGTVTLRFIVTREGAVTDINIHQIEGDERFGREAARAVTVWRFDPAVKQGMPVPYWFFQKVYFELDD